MDLNSLSAIPLNSWGWIWIVAFVAFLTIEAMSPALLTIWFAFASLISVFLAFFGVSVYVQFVSFFSTSILLLIFTRPILKKYVYKDKENIKTNVNALIGKTGIVTKEINEHDYGEVKVNGQIWTAVLENSNENITPETKVLISSISGVKLVVKKA